MEEPEAPHQLDQLHQLPDGFDFARDCWITELPPEIWTVITEMIVRSCESEFLLCTGKYVDDRATPVISTLHPKFDVTVGGYAINGMFYMTRPPKPEAPTRAHSERDGPNCNDHASKWLTYIPNAPTPINTMQLPSNAYEDPYGNPFPGMVRPSTQPMKFNTFAQTLPRNLPDHMLPGYELRKLRAQNDAAISNMPPYQQMAMMMEEDEDEDDEDDEDEYEDIAEEDEEGPPDLRLRLRAGMEEFDVVHERHDTRDILPRVLPANRARIDAITNRKHRVASHIDTCYIPIDGSTVQTHTNRLKILKLNKTMQILSPEITVYAQIPMLSRLDPHQPDDEFTSDPKQSYSLQKYLIVAPLVWVKTLACSSGDVGLYEGGASASRALRANGEPSLQFQDGEMKFKTSARVHDYLPTDQELFVSYDAHTDAQKGLYNALRLEGVGFKKLIAMLVHTQYTYHNRFCDMNSCLLYTSPSPRDS